jgi:catechol 2,3-dioxygenase-like lactoylglutathione lyase family enzyme
MHHVGLATHDMEATLTFYEQILGFETRVCDLLKPEGGGVIRHAFMDAGNGEMIMAGASRFISKIPITCNWSSAA